MCGIAGIVGKRGRLSPETLGRYAATMADRQTYRGPDGHGVWISSDGACALAHRRLAVIDPTEAGRQPMLGRRGAAVTFNGEIYNFVELREELEQQGVQFRSRTDTEVLVAALDTWGRNAVDKLDGMFAFARYDAADRSLLLARDLFGEKPLYYVDAPDYFAFSSELHALTSLPGFDARVFRDDLAAFLAFQYVPAPGTIYRSARKLEPGSTLSLRVDGPLRVQRYAQFRTSGSRASTRSLDDLADELEEVLSRSVRRRMISDVPLGAFLSGGVDSSTIAAVVTRKLGQPLKTFSIGFAGDPQSEHLEAAETARQLQTEHHDRVISAYGVDLGRQIATALDEPNADSSCVPTWLVSRHAREHVTVALSGDGGDELFGGYGRYFNTVQEQERQEAGDRQLDWWSLGEVYLGNRVLVFDENEIRSVMGGVPEGYARFLAQERRKLELDERPLLNVLREYDARSYLPGDVLAKVDRMSMQHSLEVRAPLLGREVAAFASRLAAADCYDGVQGKLVLKRLASRWLPEEWLRRPKRGFGLPVELWDQAALLPELERILLSRDCRLAKWIKPTFLRSYLKRLKADFVPYRAWTLFILEHWLRTHPAVPA